MKKIYISALCAMLCSSAAIAGRHLAPRKDSRHVRIAKIEEAVKVMRPASQVYFDYIDGEWLEMAKSEFTYDANGNILTEQTDEDGYMSRSVSEYNADNMLVSIVATVKDGDEWVNDSKRTYVYDTVVKDFYTERLGYDWNDNDWVRNYYCEANEISRNEAGNITSVLKSLPLANTMYAAYKSEWGYENADGPATEFGYYFNYNTEGEPEWTLYNATSYRNIRWHKFNGQLTGDDITEYVTGENLIAQADVYYEDEPDGHFFVEYNTDGGYLIKETYADPTVVGATLSLTYTDSYGSMVMEENEYFDEDGNPTETPTYTMREVVTMNEHGDVISDELFEIFEAEPELVDGSRFEYEYYADGNVKTVTQYAYDFDSCEYGPMMRIEYDGYFDCAGVADIAAAPLWQPSADEIRADIAGMTAMSIYSLLGVKLLGTAADSGKAVLSTASLPRGIYIVKAEGTRAWVKYCK